MKRIIFIGFLSIFVVASVLFAVNYKELFHRGKFLDVGEVGNKWGKAQFTKKKWQNASTEERGKMAASLLKQKKKYIGLFNYEITEKLGSSTSHYVSDLIPAYLIEYTGVKGDEVWELVFLIDKHNKVWDVRVHRHYPG